jgi:cytochrome c-type biogenesis protein
MELFALSSLALVAGLVSFTAPCTLPLLPGYVAYISGVGNSSPDTPSPPGGVRLAERTSTRRVLVCAALFVAGFSVVFVALGVTASRLGFLLAQSERQLNLVSGAFIVFMGLATTGLLRVPILQRQLRVDFARIGTGPRAALPMGAAFAFGWTPCVGPVLAAVLATAASTATMGEGAVLLGAYSLGLGLPFLALAAAVSRGGGRMAWLRRQSRKIELVGGTLLAVMGVAVMTGQWTVAMSWMLSLYARVGWPPI